MSILTFFLVGFIWIGIFHHLKNRASKYDEENSLSFWQIEHQANTVRRKDISTLPYISIPLNELPFQEHANSEIMEYQTIIQNLASQRIVNLSSMSNTDLKLTYGPANLDTLSEYDSNYTLLIRTLSDWGQSLFKQGDLSAARKIFEFGISCKTDIKNNYILLAQIYHENQEFNKISDLISQAETLDTLMKQSILSELHHIYEN